MWKKKVWVPILNDGETRAATDEEKAEMMAKTC